MKTRLKLGYVFGFAAIILFFLFVSAALWGWAIMLAAGVLWHEFGWLRPIGFGPSLLIGVLLSFIFGRNSATATANATVKR